MIVELNSQFHPLTPANGQNKDKTRKSNKKKKKSNTRKRLKWRWLQYSAWFFVLEGIVWSRDAHEEGVVPRVFVAVVHEVYRGLGYLERHGGVEVTITQTQSPRSPWSDVQRTAAIRTRTIVRVTLTLRGAFRTSRYIFSKLLSCTVLQVWPIQQQGLRLRLLRSNVVNWTWACFIRSGRNGLQSERWTVIVNT